MIFMRLKKTRGKARRTGRSGKEGHGDHHRHQGKNRNAVCAHLQGHEDPFIDPGPVAEEAKGESSSSESSGPKKVEPFDASLLDAEIRVLNHGAKYLGTLCPGLQKS